MMIVILGAVSACIFFALEINERKSDAASLLKATSNSHNDVQELNASINSITQLNHTVHFALTSIQSLNNSFNQRASQNQLSTDNTIQQLNNVILQIIQSIAVLSCAALPPSSSSGYYWVKSSNDTAVRVYCDMTKVCGNITGGWMRVAELNMSNSDQQCPSELIEHNNSDIRTCTRPTVQTTQTSLFSPSNGLSYSKVCGSVITYQYGYINPFHLEAV